MDNTTNKNKKLLIVFSVLLLFILDFFVYKNQDSFKKYFGFATAYDFGGGRAVSNDWIISSTSTDHYAWGENIGWIDFLLKEEMFMWQIMHFGVMFMEKMLVGSH